MPRADAWQQVKFDRQILAIAVVEGCAQLVSGDKRLARDAHVVGLNCVTVGELELPASAAQRSFDLSDEAAPPQTRPDAT